MVREFRPEYITWIPSYSSGGRDVSYIKGSSSKEDETGDNGPQTVCLMSKNNDSAGVSHIIVYFFAFLFKATMLNGQI